MFVFKAAVVGAGTMGGQIAQTIAASGIPVVLKDVKDELVQAGLDEARNVTQGQVAGLVEEGQAHRGAGRGAGRGGRRAHPRRHDLRGLRRRRLRHRGRARAHGDQAGGLRRARRRHAGPRDPRLEHVVAVDHRDRRGDQPPRQGRRLPLLLPGVDHAPDRDRRGRRHLGRDRRRSRSTSRRRSASSRSPAPRCPASSSTASSTPGISEIWREQEEKGLSIKAIDEGVGAASVVPMGPYFLVNLLGLDTVLHVAEHLRESYGERFYVPKGMQRLVADGKLGAKTGGDGVYTPQGEPDARGRRRARRRRARRAAHAEDVRRGVPRARGGRRHPPRHRRRHDGRRRPRPAPRPPPAVHEGRHRGPRRRSSSAWRAPPSATASASRRRSCCAGSSPRGAWARRAARASTPTRSPTTSSPARSVKLETRGDVAIAWLANGLMNSIAPQVIVDLRAVWEKVEGSGVRALVIASSNPLLFSAGADIKAFTSMDEAGGRELLESGARAAAQLRALEHRHHRRGQRPGLRRRLRAGHGLRRAHRRAVGALRPARGQARDHPRLRRHAAPAAARGREQGAGDEPRRRRDRRRGGLRLRPRQPRGARPRAARHRAGVGAQARRAGAAGGRRDQGGLGQAPTSTTASRPRRPPSRAVFASEDAREGIGAFLGKRQPTWRGR